MFSPLFIIAVSNFTDSFQVLKFCHLTPQHLTDAILSTTKRDLKLLKILEVFLVFLTEYTNPCSETFLLASCQNGDTYLFLHKGDSSCLLRVLTVLIWHPLPCSFQYFTLCRHVPPHSEPAQVFLIWKIHPHPHPHTPPTSKLSTTHLFPAYNSAAPDHHINLLKGIAQIGCFYILISYSFFNSIQFGFNNTSLLELLSSPSPNTPVHS